VVVHYKINGRSKIIDHTKDGRDNSVVCKHYHSVIVVVIEAELNGARKPQTATAKQLRSGAGKTELAFIGISDIVGYTVSLRLSAGATIYVKPAPAPVLGASQFSLFI
jgi:hypothetical protein